MPGMRSMEMFMIKLDWEPLVLTLQLATVTTVILFAIGMPLSYWLSLGRRAPRFRRVVEILVYLPLVLPPTVLGFYLLLLLGPKGVIGSVFESLCGLRLVFNFGGLVIGSVIFSLPFMVQPLKAGFDALDKRMMEASWTLGHGAWKTFWRVVLPNVKAALLTGCLLSFAHTVGEFGVVMMIGGNIPGETQVASTAIYNSVEALRYGQAHAYAGLLVVLTLVILACVRFPRWEARR